MAFPRADWGAIPPKESYATSVKTDVVIHYSDSPGQKIDTIREQIRTLREIQNFHMFGRGWNDIAYNLLLFQPRGRLRRPRLYWGRPFWANPAAQENANSGTVALCVIAAPGERISQATVDRIVRAIRSMQKHHPSLRFIGGHRDYTSTSCPGDILYSKLPEIARRTGLHRK